MSLARSTQMRNGVGALAVLWLIGVVFLIKPHLQHLEHQQEVRIHRVIWFNGNLAERLSYWELPPTRQYKDIKLTGSVKDDERSLAIADSLVRDIVLEGDTTRGVHFVFGDGVNFGILSDVLSLLEYNQAKHYLIIDSELWFLFVNRTPPEIDSTEVVLDPVL